LQSGPVTTLSTIVSLPLISTSTGDRVFSTVELEGVSISSGDKYLAVLALDGHPGFAWQAASNSKMERKGNA
jgi:hypothetical protein